MRLRILVSLLILGLAAITLRILPVTPEALAKAGWISLLPPLIAITMALITKQVLVSLFIGVWVGTSILSGGLLPGLMTLFNEHLVAAIVTPGDLDYGHAKILLFSLSFGGIVGVISANGGLQAIVNLASRYATSARRGQLTTALMGVVIFFDDYTNTLLVGNMMRPFTDKLRISREKLSYLVDSTAAPVASIAVISTWSVFQMSLLDGPYQHYGVTENPYITFLRSIPYSFYCLLTLVFVFSNVLTRLDFGPMLKAEVRARTTGAVLAPEASPMADLNSGPGQLPVEATHWRNALIPIVVVVGITLAGMVVTGKQSLGAEGGWNLSAIAGGADAYASLMWGSYLAGMTAILLSVVTRTLTLQRALDAWLNGVRSLLLACIILVLAWSLGSICEHLHTADFLVRITANFLTPALLPAVTFLTAAAISFATGSSWATMSILVPVITPMAIQIMGAEPNAIVATPVFVSTFAAILSGSTFGDHCSPISDTTIISSMASGADHIDHVRTQLPYALTVGLIALLAGFLLVGLGINYWFIVIISVVLVGGALRLLGKPVRLK